MPRFSASESTEDKGTNYFISTKCKSSTTMLEILKRDRHISDLYYTVKNYHRNLYEELRTQNNSTWQSGNITRNITEVSCAIIINQLISHCGLFAYIPTH